MCSMTVIHLPFLLLVLICPCPWAVWAQTLFFFPIPSLEPCLLLWGLVCYKVTKMTETVELFEQNELTNSLGSISWTRMSKRIMRIPDGKKQTLWTLVSQWSRDLFLCNYAIILSKTFDKLYECICVMSSWQQLQMKDLVIEMLNKIHSRISATGISLLA